MTKIIILSLAATLIFCGCGAILNSSSQSFDVYEPRRMEAVRGVTLTSEPNIGEYMLPATITLSKTRSYVLKFSKDGYRDATIQVRSSIQPGFLIFDVVLTGLIGVVIDAISKGWNGLGADKEPVYLKKIDLNIVGPDSIRVAVWKSSTENKKPQEWESSMTDDEEEDFINLNITVGGEPVEKIKFKIPAAVVPPRICSHCETKVNHLDTLCPKCWMPIE